MRVHTKTVWQIEDSGSFTLLSDEFYDYSGPVAEARNRNKQRAEEEAKWQSARARQLAGQQNVLYGAYSPWMLSLIPKPGETSSVYSRAQLAKDLQSIRDVYSGFGAMSRLAGTRSGFQRPSGDIATDINALNRERARAELSARQQEPLNVLNQGFGALGAAQNQYGAMNPLPASETAAGGFRWASQQPGFWSKFGKALQIGASIAAAPFTGGASLSGLTGDFSGFSGLFKKTGGTAPTTDESGS